MIDRSRISIGLRASVGPATVRVLAPLIERLGFRSLWLSDSAEGNALAGLAAAAEVTSTLRLATGVIPLDRRPVHSIAEALVAIPMNRLTVGIGSGNPLGGLARVRDGITEIRDLTTAPVVVGALGPVMRRLAAEEADGVLFNWLSPSAATAALADLVTDRGERDVRSTIYVRTIMDASARAALEAEIARKAVKRAYVATAIQDNPINATIDGERQFRESVGRYLDVVDELVLRAVTAGTSVDDYVAFITRASTHLTVDQP